MSAWKDPLSYRLGLLSYRGLLSTWKGPPELPKLKGHPEVLGGPLSGWLGPSVLPKGLLRHELPRGSLNCGRDPLSYRS